jgi:hypothetical protein
MVTVRPAEPGEVVSSAALPVGPLAPPPPAVPKSRNAPTAMPAKPPVSIRPTPLRRSERRSARAWRRSSASSSSAPPRPPAAACEAPRAGSSARLACEARREAGSSGADRPPPCEPPRAALALSAAFAAARASTRDIRGSAAAAPMTRVLSECREPDAPGSPSSGSCDRACDFARRGPSTFGMRTVVRESCEFESSSPVAPQPGQDTAPLRCLRQVLQ